MEKPNTIHSPLTAAKQPSTMEQSANTLPSEAISCSSNQNPRRSLSGVIRTFESQSLKRMSLPPPRGGSSAAPASRMSLPFASPVGRLEKQRISTFDRLSMAGGDHNLSTPNPTPRRTPRRASGSHLPSPTAQNVPASPRLNKEKIEPFELLANSSYHKVPRRASGSHLPSPTAQKVPASPRLNKEKIEPFELLANSSHHSQHSPQNTTHKLEKERLEAFERKQREEQELIKAKGRFSLPPLPLGGGSSHHGSPTKTDAILQTSSSHTQSSQSLEVKIHDDQNNNADPPLSSPKKEAMETLLPPRSPLSPPKRQSEPIVSSPAIEKEPHKIPQKLKVIWPPVRSTKPKIKQLSILNMVSPEKVKARQSVFEPGLDNIRSLEDAKMVLKGTLSGDDFSAVTTSNRTFSSGKRIPKRARSSLRIRYAGSASFLLDRIMKRLKELGIPYSPELLLQDNFRQSLMPTKTESAELRPLQEDEAPSLPPADAYPSTPPQSPRRKLRHSPEKSHTANDDFLSPHARIRADNSWYDEDLVSKEEIEVGKLTHNRPDIWITPDLQSPVNKLKTKVSSTPKNWRVRRVWNIPKLDEKEEEHRVPDSQLMSKVKSLLGIFEANPYQAPWLINNDDGSNKDSNDTTKNKKRCEDASPKSKSVDAQWTFGQGKSDGDFGPWGTQWVYDNDGIIDEEAIDEQEWTTENKMSNKFDAVMKTEQERHLASLVEEEREEPEEEPVVAEKEVVQTGDPDPIVEASPTKEGPVSPAKSEKRTSYLKDKHLKHLRQLKSNKGKSWLKPFDFEETVADETQIHSPSKKTKKKRGHKPKAKDDEYHAGNVGEAGEKGTVQGEGASNTSSSSPKGTADGEWTYGCATEQEDELKLKRANADTSEKEAPRGEWAYGAGDEQEDIDRLKLKSIQEAPQKDAGDGTWAYAAGNGPEEDAKFTGKAIQKKGTQAPESKAGGEWKAEPGKVPEDDDEFTGKAIQKKTQESKAGGEWKVEPGNEQEDEDEFTGKAIQKKTQESIAGGEWKVEPGNEQEDEDEFTGKAIQKNTQGSKVGGEWKAESGMVPEDNDEFMGKAIQKNVKQTQASKAVGEWKAEPGKEPEDDDEFTGKAIQKKTQESKAGGEWKVEPGNKQEDEDEFTGKAIQRKTQDSKASVEWKVEHGNQPEDDHDEFTGKAINKIKKTPERNSVKKEKPNTGWTYGFGVGGDDEEEFKGKSLKKKPKRHSTKSRKSQTKDHREKRKGSVQELGEDGKMKKRGGSDLPAEGEWAVGVGKELDEEDEFNTKSMENVDARSDQITKGKWTCSPGGKEQSVDEFIATGIPIANENSEAPDTSRKEEEKGSIRTEDETQKKKSKKKKKPRQSEVTEETFTIPVAVSTLDESSSPPTEKPLLDIPAPKIVKVKKIKKSKKKKEGNIADLLSPPGWSMVVFED